jgi:hypothetical protein
MGAIDFELRTWTSQVERWPTIRTEPAVAVYTALHDEEMTIPCRSARCVWATSR